MTRCDCERRATVIVGSIAGLDGCEVADYLVHPMDGGNEAAP
jgi:hypothetical protein